MQNNLQVSPLLQFIYTRQFKQVQVIDQPQYFTKIKKAVEILPINGKFFQTIVNLIRFFKFSFLIFLKKPFQTIINNPQLLIQHQGELKKIAKMAHDMIGPGGHIYELDFIFEKGIDHSYYKKLQIKQQKRKIIDYLKQLSATKKKLDQLIADKQIVQDDIMRFQSSNYGSELKYLDWYLQNCIKSSIPQMQKQCQQIIKQKKLKQKLQKIKQQKQLQLERSIKQKQSQQSQPKQNKQSSQQNLDQIFVCCRKFFYQKQIIYQPQSINVVYQYKHDYFSQQLYGNILKTICGFLNSQGGVLFIGVKQDKNTYKKQVQGYTIIQKDKAQFRNQISQLADTCISPSISHDMLKVLFVPLKNRKNQFLNGKFVIKIVVRYGQRKQLYSFKQNVQSRKEYFALRTDNDTKLITSAQQVLAIYRNRLLQTPAEPKPLHRQPCPKPDNGRPLYELQQFGKRQKQTNSDNE